MAYRDPTDSRARDRYKRYRSKPEAKAKNAAYMRRRRATDSAFAESQRARCREWQKANRPYVNMKARERRKKTPLEIVVEDYLIERVDALGGLCVKFITPGKRGAPDRLVILPGYPTLYVELKRPRLGKLSESQKRYHTRLRDLGQRVWTLWSKEEVDAFILEVTLT
jgi:hypothetical protein